MTEEKAHHGSQSSQEQERSHYVAQDQGRGNPGRTPDEEVETRIDATLQLLKQRIKKNQIKSALMTSFGICARTAENYLARARERLLVETKRSRDDHVLEAYGFYQSVITSDDPKVTLREKMIAQSHLDRLLGLNAPVKVAQTDTNGKDIDPDARRARLADLAKSVGHRLVSGEPADQSSAGGGD